MKFNKSTLIAISLVFCMAVGVVVADFRGDLRLWTGIEADTKTASAPGAVIDGNLRFGTVSSVSLTSPTVTFTPPAGFCRIKLSSDASQTGIYPADGVDGQLLMIESADTGSNTMRIDDGANVACGSDFTLTESQDDSIWLLWDDDADIWKCVAKSDN